MHKGRKRMFIAEGIGEARVHGHGRARCVRGGLMRHSAGLQFEMQWKGFPGWSRDYDSRLPMQGTWIQPLDGELKSCMPHGMDKFFLIR